MLYATIIIIIFCFRIWDTQYNYLNPPPPPSSPPPSGATSEWNQDSMPGFNNCLAEHVVDNLAPVYTCALLDVDSGEVGNDGSALGSGNSSYRVRLACGVGSVPSGPSNSFVGTPIQLLGCNVE